MKIIDQKFPAVAKLAPFGIFERFTAGFCMAIPFFLLIAHSAVTNGNYYWLLLMPIGLTVFISFVVPMIANRYDTKMFQGAVLTAIAGIFLFLFYLVFAKVFKLEGLKSISAFVTMRDSFVFGMVLAIGAMLFITNGAVYFNETKILLPAWRKGQNIIAGLLLLGVVTFPCTTLPILHFTCAIPFFIICVLGTLRREKPKDDKKGLTAKEFKQKKRSQLLTDYGAVGVVVIALLYWAGTQFYWYELIPWLPIDLFGVESIALWIVGVDFILVSLKREKI